MYMDKIITFSSKNTIYFYNYELTDPNEKDDIKRLSNKALYKCIGNINMIDNNNIITYDCYNTFQSNILISCGTDHNINIFDISNNKIISNFKDCHYKSTNKIKLFDFENSNSNYFLTSSYDNIIYLYDLRIKNHIISEFIGTNNTKIVSDIDISHNFN